MKKPKHKMMNRKKRRRWRSEWRRSCQPCGELAYDVTYNFIVKEPRRAILMTDVCCFDAGTLEYAGRTDGHP